MSIPTNTRRFITDVVGVPASPSPISHAVVVGNTCWISGQLSVGADGHYLSGTARQEAQRAFDLVFLVAEAAGFSREEIVFVDLAFQNLDDLVQVNSLYEELFASDRRPARTVYQAARLPYGAKVKVQVIAARS